MEPVKTIRSQVVPVPMKDVDTDLIIPAQYLTSISRGGYGENLFRRLKDGDPNFSFNLPKYKSAQILVADDNFGCGSSREHAVWALRDAGIKAVISKSFADIFYNNSAKNGLLLVKLPADVVDEMLAESAKQEKYEATVDLAGQYVELPSGKRVSFDFDEFRKYCLLNGLDDIEYIRSYASDIQEFRNKQKETLCTSPSR
jgi:3-isopropylmalate/(R)-2-methylmalate dehydratase small subunit